MTGCGFGALDRLKDRYVRDQIVFGTTDLGFEGESHQ